jgi:hypothetical protein
MKPPLARNIAEVIDDLNRQHAPPRDHERLIELVQHQIEHAMGMAVEEERRRRDRGRQMGDLIKALADVRTYLRTVLVSTRPDEHKVPLREAFEIVDNAIGNSDGRQRRMMLCPIR